MDTSNLIRAALRYRAIYLDIDRADIDPAAIPGAPQMAFVARLAENGFCVSEELLHALAATDAIRLARITEIIDDVMGVNLNWATLVKGWDVPTGETAADHLLTLFANVFGDRSGMHGTVLPCGHMIPDGTFPLERYTGCPFCGTPFVTADFVYRGQASRLKELRLFTPADMRRAFDALLSSTVPLDATQADTLRMLLEVYPAPEGAAVAMKETVMLVVDALIADGRQQEASRLLRTPTDILRYLWFRKTGQVRIIEPRTLQAHAQRLYSHMFGPLDRGVKASKAMKKRLRLKYGRRECLRVAQWLNSLPMSAAAAAEDMNPKREMWVRMIHALRLGEYSRRPGFGHLAEILDVFYRDSYVTWQGTLDREREGNHADRVLEMLAGRPGLFARCLFSTMLRFGADKTCDAFEEVCDSLPARLLLSLENNAPTWFDRASTRVARPITGIPKEIRPNKLLLLYSSADLTAMADRVADIFRKSMLRRYAASPGDARSIYIDPRLADIPLAVGDRSTTIQDTSCALQGTRFPVEGDKVRLFLQWGKGLPAQHLDMDISCHIAFADGRSETCAYYNLTATGAKHGGDIRSIPDMVGTAEYIELDLPALAEAGAIYVTFTCNAYSNGALSPNLVVGWMDSAFPMRISEENGVAYDPGCVQHMVRIGESNLAKGLVFGVLEVASREIIWLEMPFTAQTIRGCSLSTVSALLERLRRKVTIGELLRLMAEARGLKIVDTAGEADRAYTYEWALDPAAVSSLLDA